MEKTKEFFSRYLRSSIALCAGLALLLNLAIESLARQSLQGGLAFFAEKPSVFLFNTLIIFTSLSFAILVKRRIFIYILFSGLWLALGITNGVILRNRMTPFTTKDLTVAKDGLSIVTNYLSTQQLVLAAVGAVALVALVTLLFFFAPQKKGSINRKKNLAIFLAICLGLFGFTNLVTRTGVVDTFFGNLAYAYRDNGVPYCFITTWLNTGIKKPQDYTQQAVNSIFAPNELSEAEEVTAKVSDEDKANIIFLQLESFIDPTQVKGITVSEDPVPHFRQLKSEFSSGYLTVPSVGAGTANTEFEILCGMSVKFFGPGEYPYKSVLTEESCESIPYDLKEIGYTTHAIHNHRGAFYGRNKVFANLGFDTFTSLEYMNKVAKTPKNWSKDRILTSEIMDALASSGGRDYIYTISVQGHGKYPTEEVLKLPRITVEAPTEELKWQYEYYVNQIYEMDLFLQDLVDALSRYDEKTVLVFYGDHLPALDMQEGDMKSGSVYQTQYVLWSNFPMEKEDKDLYAYQLSAEVLDRLGIHEGTMVSYHQNHQDDPDYRTNLLMLEYDILYGKRYIYGGKEPFPPTKLQMGINPIRIDSVVEINGKFFIKGQNFTEFSKVSLDGNVLKTVYWGSTILALQEKLSPDEISRLKISQVEKNKEILSTTE